MGHIVFAGTSINYIVDSMDVKYGLNHTTSPYIGQLGSSTSFVSMNSRVVSCKSICLSSETSNGKPLIGEYIALAKQYAQVTGVLTSKSTSNIDGNYLITGFDYTENTNGDYELSWEFTEVEKYNVTSKTFRVWNKAQSKKNKAKKTTKKTSGGANINSNLKYLLKNCGVMKRNDSKKGIKCVKCLQIYLQSQGYYKNYKLDGWYSKYTQQAVKQLQKKYKLKSTGAWDKETIKYFQKKYKYPVDLLDASNKKLEGKHVSKKPVTFSTKKG